MKSFNQYIMDSEDMKGLAEPRKVQEDIELVSGIGRPTRYDMETSQDEFDYGRKKDLGKIHKDYSLHRGENGDFFIHHDESKKVVGHISNDAPHKHKTLKVGLTTMDPKHTKKKIGHSLAVAAYKHLHGKHGYEIESGAEQSLGGKSLWDHLMQHPSTKNHVHAVHQAPGSHIKTDLGLAHKLDPSEIWQSGSREVRRAARRKGINLAKDIGVEDPTYNVRLVLRRKKK